MNTNLLTSEEAERVWYVAGWPAPQRAEDLDDALECQQWRDLADSYGAATPSELGDRLAAGKYAQEYREALDALADWLDGVPLGDVISDFMFAPDREYLAVGLDRIDRPGWCPMTTAPLDATEPAVDLWANGKRHADCSRGGGQWWNARGMVSNPSHWMAIPTGPTA